MFTLCVSAESLIAHSTCEWPNTKVLAVSGKRNDAPNIKEAVHFSKILFSRMSRHTKADVLSKTCRKAIDSKLEVDEIGFLAAFPQHQFRYHQIDRIA